MAGYRGSQARNRGRSPRRGSSSRYGRATNARMISPRRSSARSSTRRRSTLRSKNSRSFGGRQSYQTSSNPMRGQSGRKRNTGGLVQHGKLVRYSAIEATNRAMHKALGNQKYTMTNYTDPWGNTYPV